MLGLDIDVHAFQYCENKDNKVAIQSFYKQRKSTNLSVFDDVDNILRFTFNRKNQITLKELIKADWKYKNFIIDERFAKKIRNKLNELQKELKQSNLMLRESDNAEQIWFTIEKKVNSSSLSESYSIVRIDVTNLTIANNAFLLHKDQVYSQIFDIEKTRQTTNKVGEPQRLSSLKPENINPFITELELKKLINESLAKFKTLNQLSDVEITCLVSQYTKVGMKWTQTKKKDKSQIEIAKQQFENLLLRLLERIYNLTDFFQHHAKCLIDFLEQQPKKYEVKNLKEELISLKQERAANKMISVLIKANILNHLTSKNEVKQEKIRKTIKIYIYNSYVEQITQKDDQELLNLTVYLFYNNPINQNVTLMKFANDIRNMLNNIQQQVVCENFPIFTIKEIEMLYLKHHNDQYNDQMHQGLMIQMEKQLLQKIQESEELRERKLVIESALQTLQDQINKQDITIMFSKAYIEKLHEPNFSIEIAIPDVFLTLVKQFLIEIQEEF